MSEKFIKNGTLTVPLFHGTSTLFLESIQEHGLGGVNPIDTFSVRNFVQQAYGLCDSILAGEKEWDACKFSASWCNKQESFSDNANFQHGDTYLTPSRASAVGYALTNRFGSELLSLGAKLIDLIQERRPELLEQHPLMRHPVRKLVSSDSKPILITARNVSIDMLRSESGDNPQKQIELLETLWPIDPDTVLNINFRLCSILSSNSLKIEYLDPKQEKNAYDW